MSSISKIAVGALYLIPLLATSDALTIEKRALTLPATLPNGWISQGCYIDVAGRTLTGPSYASDGQMSAEACIAYCQNAGYPYAGTEYSSQCYCGSSLAAGSGPANTNDCSMPCTGNGAEPCGGPNRLNLFYSGIGPQVNPGPGLWNFVGCYTEGTNGRALTNGGNTVGGSAQLTVSACTTACQQAGYVLAGVEYSGECYCGNSIQNGGALAPDGLSGCNMLCNGNKSEYCGGPGHLNMYDYNKAVTLPPYTTISTSSSSTKSSSSSSTSSSSSSRPSTSSSTSIGSTSSSSSKSTASTSGSTSTSSSSSSSKASTSTSSSSSTSSKPTSTSSSTSSSSSGSKPSSTSSTSSSSSSKTSTSTSSTASVAPTLAHGRAIAGWTYQGCWSEATTGRALSGLSTYDYPAMTLEECANHCAAFTYFGVEYGGECYCGNSLGAGSVNQTSSTSCSFVCPGSQYEYCGAGNQMELYRQANVPVTPTTGTSTGTNPTSTSTSAGNTPTPTVPSYPAINGYTYQGCYLDGVSGRILSNQQPDNQGLTLENCVAACASQGYSIAGMEYAIQCFCDNAIYNGGVLDPNQATACNTQCSGNSKEFCGGNGGRISIYSVGTPKIYHPPSAQKDNLPPNWTYVGCLQDNIPSAEDANIILPNFPYMVWNSQDANSPVACINICQQFGYNAAGVEYGSECFCGDAQNLVVASAPGVNADPRVPQVYTRSTPPKFVDDSQCNSVCSGDKTHMCGSGNLMNYYTWNGTTPLYEFGFPTGASAGQYSLLIGGVTVPLMTAQVITGKVTFTEKYGEQESNGTGAYSLDLTQINNFDAAWQTLTGLQTDVFCSAGLILPDKAGRQMTIGGWAGESNFGVRFYTPDGAPGVKGTNEWTENPGVLSLQVPRWYPSVLTLANGSLAVIGGEIAQNAAEQPTLELLPPTGVKDPTTISGYSNTTVYLDFLDRTAPFNLYPFVTVLPSGGIFIAYFNEARILDEVTFSTTRTLPNMPGAVNNPQAGRTYQLEGTMVTLPQYSPFTDPLGVLICGGSTAVGDDGDPIDNCISTTPESANPTWTIERMPSRRVMSCMAALPDGTYLILNGAQHGKAGFGLGASPNYNAVLYDPTKPVNQRMSIMANTTVARLYHSEAITLLDGRVLVSGSDPTGNYNNPVGSFPEEYRVEVFTPPYLLSGLPRPTFKMTSLDWNYKDVLTITVNLPNGNAPKVSMLGAVVSTHGNSMGQRTLFLNVVCAGNTCHITAPPNAHVAPPGWYAITVLDGPTPSVGQFVRIGKDPANIGNWPQGIPGITPPGI